MPSSARRASATGIAWNRKNGPWYQGRSVLKAEDDSLGQPHPTTQRDSLPVGAAVNRRRKYRAIERRLQVCTDLVATRVIDRGANRNCNRQRGQSEYNGNLAIFATPELTPETLKCCDGLGKHDDTWSVVQSLIAIKRGESLQLSFSRR